MERSPLLDDQAQAGARLGARPEAPEHDAALTFGDVPGEYAAVTSGSALLDQTDLAVVSVEGSEAAAFLHRILAGDVRGLADGQGNRNSLLSPKGKVLHLFELERHGDGFLLFAPPGTATALKTALDMFLFSEDVQLEDRTADHAPLLAAGPAARERLTALLGSAAPEPGHHAPFETPGGVAVHVSGLIAHGAPALRIDGGAEGARALWAELLEAGFVPAGLVARDCARLETASGLFGLDVDDNVYPQEARLEDSFSLEKGCYVGQEVVAKIDTYGGLNKRLELLRLSGEDPVARGTRLVREIDGERRDLGVVTSWAYSFALDAPAALAYVKRKHQEPGTEFELEGTGQTGTLVSAPVR